MTTAQPAADRPLIADWEMLESYRLQLKMRLASSNDESQFIQWKVYYERAKQWPAAHLMISMDGPGLPRVASPMQVETIAIGTTTWNKIENKWTQKEYDQAQSWHGNWEGLEKNFRRLQFNREETINGILCKHYLVDEYTTSGVDFLSQRIKMTSHAQGDLWIANQPDLPTVAVRLRLQMRTKGFYSSLPSTNKFPAQMLEQSELVYDIEYDVTDLNAPIDIKPPAGFRRPQIVTTATPLPNNSQPAPALRPTSTLSLDQIRRQMTALLWEDDAQGEVGFLHYSLDPDGNGLILDIDARCINVKCDANFMASVFETLAAMIKSGVKFEATVTAVTLVIHGAHGEKTGGAMMVRWRDAVDFAHNRITFEELTQKAFFHHIY